MNVPGPLLLALGGATVFSGLLVGLGAMLRPRPSSRLTPLQRPSHLVAGHGLSGLARRASSAADGVLDRGHRRGPLETLLEQAAVPMSAGECLALATVVAVASLALGLSLLGPLAGLLFPAVLIGGSWLFLRKRRDRRRARFSEQLPDVLQLLAGNLRVGYGLLQSVDTAAKEAQAPASDELRRAIAEMRLGRDSVESLAAIAERLANEDFGWVVQAISINRDVGGDLAEVLDSVADTVRARARLARHVSALAAEGRMSAKVLVAMPIGVGAFTWLTNRTYVSLLFTSGFGLALVGLCVVLMVSGSLWLRRLIRPVY
jgi:tight adherence protein B